MKADLRAALPGILVALLVLVPFFDKPFTVDDTLFLREAEHALREPLRPGAFEYVWFSSPERFSAILTNGPAMAYLLTPIVAVGAPEWLAHLESWLFLALGIWGTAACARRLGCGPRECWVAATLLACTPVALAMAATSMPDVPAMSAGVWGIERYLAWTDGRRRSQGWQAAALLALAILLRLHAAGLLFVTLAAAAARVAGPTPGARLRRVLAGGWWWPPALALVLTAIVLLATADPRSPGLGTVAAVGRFFYPRGMARNLLALGVHWVVCAPLALAWLACARRPARPAAAAAAAFLVLFAVGALLRRPGEHRAPLHAVALAAFGLATLISVVVSGWRERDAVQLTLGLWLLVALPVVVYVHLPAKYLLVSAPAAAILVARRLAHPSRAQIVAVAVLAAAGVLLAILINRADARLGSSARLVARASVRPAVAAGKRVWFAGHWGFQWYLEQAGARCLSTDSRVQMAAGDLLVVDRLQYRWLQVEPGRPFGRLLALETDADPGGRIMQDGAGFYDNSMGLWPWVWGSSAAARVEVWSLD